MYVYIPFPLLLLVLVLFPHRLLATLSPALLDDRPVAEQGYVGPPGPLARRRGSIKCQEWWTVGELGSEIGLQGDSQGIFECKEKSNRRIK